MEYTITGSNDFSALTFDELQELLQLVQDTERELRAEVGRRGAIAAIPARVEALVGQYLDATGRESGSEWVAPVGAHDSYPEGWEVAHSGKVWRSLVTGNVWEPGDLTIPTHAMLWEEVVVEEPEEPEGPTEPEEPTEPETPSVQEWNGSSVTYLSGDLVTFNGATYRCITGHTSQAGWTPAAVPALWAVV